MIGFIHNDKSYDDDLSWYKGEQTGPNILPHITWGKTSIADPGCFQRVWYGLIFVIFIRYAIAVSSSSYNILFWIGFVAFPLDNRNFIKAHFYNVLCTRRIHYFDIKWSGLQLSKIIVFFQIHTQVKESPTNATKINSLGYLSGKIQPSNIQYTVLTKYCIYFVFIYKLYLTSWVLVKVTSVRTHRADQRS